MKFSKLMLIVSGILSSTSLMAMDMSSFPEHKCREEKKEIHTPYVAYETDGYGVSYPSVGYRHQNGSYIYDVNGGYKYLNTIVSSWKVAKVGANIYRSFYQNPTGQLYAGIGIDAVGAKCKSFDYSYVKKDYSWGISPTLSIGHDFNMDSSKKLFFELTYKPYSIGKNGNYFMHSTGARMGIGF